MRCPTCNGTGYVWAVNASFQREQVFNHRAAIARRLWQQHGIKLLVVDNIQLLTGSGNREGNREQEISSISKGIKSMAIEFGCAAIGLSQLNDDGKLRESRSIGQDADSVWVIENDGDWQSLVQPVNLHVQKCRDGETGTVKLTFMKQWTRFESAARESEPE